MYNLHVLIIESINQCTYPIPKKKTEGLASPAKMVQENIGRFIDNQD